MDRIVEVKVNGSYLTKDSMNAGTQGESNSTALRIEFDEGWDGFAKTITWYNAKGENPKSRVLTADILEDIIASSRIYLAPVPSEALTVAGKCMFVIDGYINGKRRKSVYAEMVVKADPQGVDTTVSDPTPSQAEQLQTQIDTLIEDIAAEAKKADNAANRAEEAALHPPIVNPDTGYWMEWNADTGEYQETTALAVGQNFAILGYYPTLETLQASVTNPKLGDAYGVGVSEPYRIYIYDKANETWVDNGTIQGPKGNPFTYDDFTPEQLAALKGEKGDPFVYSDFTPEQLAGLKGEKGDPGSFDNTPASATQLGGVMADAALDTDIQPVRIGTDKKLWTAPASGNVSYQSSQTLSDTQKSTARSNIGAVSSSDVTEAINTAIGDYPTALSGLDAVIGGAT